MGRSCPSLRLRRQLAMRVSIAVPAFNEGKRLSALLERLREDAPVAVVEILVCDSLSTDTTAAAAAEQAKQDPRIRVLTAERPGKAAAWNCLIRNARAALVVFIDADVIPEPGCLKRLVEEAGETTHLLYACRRRASDPQFGLRILADPVIELSLAGGCYAARREPVLQRLHERGFREMPDVFAEDVWLQSLMDRDEFRVVNECTFRFEIHSFSAYLKIQARKRLIAYELDNRYPDLGRALRRNFPEALRPWRQVKEVVFGHSKLSAQLRWLAAGACKATVNRLFAERIAETYACLEAGYREHGGGYVLRRLASTGVRS